MSLMDKFKKEKDKILILTPVKDAQQTLPHYFETLAKLTYPKTHLSLGFLESDSRDNTFQELERALPSLQAQYSRVGLWKKDFKFQIPPQKSRKDNDIQVERRAVLAKSRNSLLFQALRDEDWVLWLDVDVIEYPADVIEQLLKTKKEIVHPNCVYDYNGVSYDQNAWADHGKKHLHDLKTEGNLVKLDSVGGTMLLVKADIHREGLIFPPFPYGIKNERIRDNNFWLGEIETEGLGIMAQDMGYQCWGMPHLEIKHLKN